MQREKTKKVSTTGTFAILTLFFVSMGVTEVTPAIAKFAEAFPNNNYVLISTLPTLFVVIATFLAGTLAGKRMSYRSLAVLGSLLFLIGGCSPALTTSFSFVLVCRAILGFGIGLMAPLGNALILGNFEGQKQANILGYGTLCMNAGGIVFQMLGGILADVSWQMTFWGHALIIVALVMAFFLPEPKKIERTQRASAAPKEKMGKEVWVIAILLLVYDMVNYPVMMNLSILFTQRNVGGATAAATALSLYTVAGCVAGLLFGMLFKGFKNYCISLGFLLSTLGAILVRFGNSGVLMTIGLMCSGFGFSTFFPAFMNWIGACTPPSTIAFASSVTMALFNLGAFLCTYWLQIIHAMTGDTLLMPINIAIVFFAIVCIVFLFYHPLKAASAPPAKEEQK